MASSEPARNSSRLEICRPERSVVLVGEVLGRPSVLVGGELARAGMCQRASPAKAALATRAPATDGKAWSGDAPGWLAAEAPVAAPKVPNAPIATHSRLSCAMAPTTAAITAKAM